MAAMPDAAPALEIRRIAPGAACPDVLGTIRYGSGAEAIALRSLAAGPTPVELWCSAGAVHSGRCGAARWRHNDRWLWVALELADEGSGADFEALTRRAYLELLAAMRATGFEHLLRVWNYLPQIHADDHGVERYRRFNAGRRQALVESGQAAFEGSPAACALGTRSGGLIVRALVGRSPALAVENPRQVSAYRYPPEYGARSPSFSRAALVDAGGGRVALLVSGTASIVGHASLHIGDVRAQTRETLANLRAVVAAAHAHTDARFDSLALLRTVYVRHAGDVPAVQSALQAELGAPAAAEMLWLEGDICRRELLVEIEAHAFAAGRLLR